MLGTFQKIIISYFICTGELDIRVLVLYHE